MANAPMESRLEKAQNRFRLLVRTLTQLVNKRGNGSYNGGESGGEERYMNFEPFKK